MRLIPSVLFLLSASTLTSCASPIQLSTCVGPYMARTCASGRIDGQPVSPRRGPLESERANNETARGQFDCEGVNLYYDYQHPCAWIHAITYDTPPAAHAVAEAVPAGESYRRYNVTINDKLIHLGTADGVNARAWADTVGRVLAQMPSLVHSLLPQPFAVVDFPTGGYFPRFCSVSFHSCDGPLVAPHTITLPAEYYQIAVQGNVTVTPEYEELLLHEIGHAFYYLVPGWRDDAAWSGAIEADGFYIAAWAERGVVEDYAESFAAWVILREYGQNLSPPTRQHINRISHRLAYFDRRLRESMPDES